MDDFTGPIEVVEPNNHGYIDSEEEFANGAGSIGSQNGFKVVQMNEKYPVEEDNTLHLNGISAADSKEVDRFEDSPMKMPPVEQSSMIREKHKNPRHRKSIFAPKVSAILPQSVLMGGHHQQHST